MAKSGPPSLLKIGLIGLGAFAAVEALGFLSWAYPGGSNRNDHYNSDGTQKSYGKSYGKSR